MAMLVETESGDVMPFSDILMFACVQKFAGCSASNALHIRYLEWHKHSLWTFSYRLAMGDPVRSGVFSTEVLSPS